MADVNQNHMRQLAINLDELQALFMANDIGGLQINIIRRNGDVRTLMWHDDGFKILLVAAGAIGQYEALLNASGTARAYDPDA